MRGALIGSNPGEADAFREDMSSFWRSEGLGPEFLKLCGRVHYRQVDIEAYEESCLATSTKTVTAQVGAG